MSPESKFDLQICTSIIAPTTPTCTTTTTMTIVVIVVVVVQLGVVGANILLHNRKSNLYLGDKSRRLGKMVDRQGS